MAQQTALQNLIDELKQFKKFPLVDQATIEAAIEFAELRLPMEKEQIIKAFQSSKIPYKYDANLTLNGFEDAEHYYNENFSK